MIIIKSRQEIELMREAGKVTALILAELGNVIKPGISTLDIDRFVEKVVKEHHMTAAEKGYCGYPANVCVSVNEEVVHGIPSRKRLLREGDIVSVDLVVEHKGYMADAARTYAVGRVSEEASRLIETAEKAFSSKLSPPFFSAGYDFSGFSRRPGAVQRLQSSTTPGGFCPLFASEDVSFPPDGVSEGVCVPPDP